MAPQPPTPPANPPAGAPAAGEPAGLDESKLGELIEARVTEAFNKLAERQPPAAPAAPAAPAPAAPAAPSAPAGGGGSSPADLAAAVNNAVTKALAERDREDQVVVLRAEIDKLKAGAFGERKAGWGAFLLGPGFAHR